MAHILFECTSGDVMRDLMWTKVVQACPGQLAGELNKMNSMCKTKFVLNALYCDYVVEWQELYIAICEFAFKVYSQYYDRDKELDM